MTRREGGKQKGPNPLQDFAAFGLDIICDILKTVVLWATILNRSATFWMTKVHKEFQSSLIVCCYHFNHPW